MRTPAAYTKNLKEHVITSDMLMNCLYSSNKRAKNWRDKEREYREKYRNNRYAYDKYDSEERAREQKKTYYAQKETMLSVLQPVCIHRETIRKEFRKRIYEYEDDYLECLNSGKFFHTGEYFDQEMQEYVEFGDVWDEDTYWHYYLFYDVGADHTFHTPIEEDDVELYNLPIIDIENIETVGHDISDLLSNQFVSKVVALILSKDFKYIA